MSEARRPWAEAWRSVGRGGQQQPSDAPDPVEYLRRFSSLPGVAGFKRASIDAMGLGPGMAALDVGCGLGPDLAPMALAVGQAGRVVGIDISAALIAQADQAEAARRDAQQSDAIKAAQLKAEVAALTLRAQCSQEKDEALEAAAKREAASVSNVRAEMEDRIDEMLAGERAAAAKEKERAEKQKAEQGQGYVGAGGGFGGGGWREEGRRCRNE